MASLEQLAANRANAQQSTGPRTPAGKARSSQNATKLGIYSKHPPLSAEDRQHAADLRRRFLTDYPPTCTAEQVLVEELISSAIRLHYLNRLEQDLWTDAPDLDTLGKISRQRTAADRSFHRSLKPLEQAKAQRLKELQNKPDSAPLPAICKNEPTAPEPVHPPAHKPQITPTPAPRFRPHFIPKDDPSGQRGYRLTPNVIYAITEDGMAAAEAHLTTLFTAMDHWPTPPTNANLPPSPLNPSRPLHPHDLLHYAAQCAIPNTPRYVRADAARCYALAAPADEPHAVTCRGIRAILCHEPDAIYDRKDLAP